MNLPRILFLGYASNIVIVTIFDICQCGFHQRRLLQKLIYNANYSVLERPVESDTTPLNVSIQFALQQIIDVDEKNQMVKSTGWITVTWSAYMFRWDPMEYGNISSLILPPDQVWIPDVLLYNSADDRFDTTMKTNVLVYSNGLLVTVPPSLFQSTCIIDITWFPFDEQNCKMKFGTWSHSGLEILFTNASPDGDIESFIKNGEWILMGLPAQQNTQKYACCPEPYYDVVYTIQIRRKVLFYLYNIILPGIIMSSLTMLSFTIPVEAGEKISFGVTILLSLTVFSLLVAEAMPPTSDAIPLAGMYFAFIMTMCAMSVGFTVMVLNFHHRTPETHVLSRFIRVGINQWLAWMLRMQRPGQTNAIDRDKILLDIRREKHHRKTAMRTRRDRVRSRRKQMKMIQNPNAVTEEHISEDSRFHNANDVSSQRQQLLSNSCRTINSADRITSRVPKSGIYTNSTAVNRLAGSPDSLLQFRNGTKKSTRETQLFDPDSPKWCNSVNINREALEIDTNSDSEVHQLQSHQLFDEVGYGLLYGEADLNSNGSAEVTLTNMERGRGHQQQRRQQLAQPREQNERIPNGRAIWNGSGPQQTQIPRANSAENDTYIYASMDERTALNDAEANKSCETTTGLKCVCPSSRIPSPTPCTPHALNHRTLIERLCEQVSAITVKMKEEEKSQEICAEWKFAAAVLDRLCIICFVCFNFICTAGILLSAPNLHVLTHNPDDDRNAVG